MLLNLHIFGDFPVIFSFIDFSLNLLWSESRHFIFLFFYSCQGMFYGPECGLPWWVFHVCLRKIDLLLLLDEVAYKCQLYLVDCLCSTVSLLTSCLLDLPTSEKDSLDFSVDIWQYTEKYASGLQQNPYFHFTI